MQHLTIGKVAVIVLTTWPEKQRKKNDYKSLNYNVGIMYIICDFDNEVVHSRCPYTFY